MTDSLFENPELLPEYLQSLQDQLDGLRAQNSRLKYRISKLEREVETAKSKRIRWRRERSRDPSERPSRDRSISIPSVGTIPDLTLPDGPISRPDLRVAAVLDEFSDVAFRYECSLVNITLGGWQPTLESHPPDLLLVESAYGGSDGSWAGRIARFGRPDDDLAAMVAWCRDRGIPTVFWCKEDPINHDWFIASSSLFDVVLTVDADLTETYRRRLGNNRVGVLQFGAQPVIHHPGVESLRVRRVAFAGSYYASKHPERREQMEWLLEPAVDYKIDIFDRMDRPRDPRFAWPERYRSNIVGSLTYPQTLEAYRRYGVFLNVNTITRSPTMCARRIYELLASGTQVVSGPSSALVGVPVGIARSADEAHTEISRALDAGPNTEGMDWVAAGNTMSARMDRILELVS